MALPRATWDGLVVALGRYLPAGFTGGMFDTGGKGCCIVIYGPPAPGRGIQRDASVRVTPGAEPFVTYRGDQDPNACHYLVRCCPGPGPEAVREIEVRANIADPASDGAAGFSIARIARSFLNGEEA